MDVQIIGINCEEDQVRAAVLDVRPDFIGLTKTLDAGQIEIYAVGFIFKYNLEAIARYVIKHKIYHYLEV